MKGLECLIRYVKFGRAQLLARLDREGEEEKKEEDQSMDLAVGRQLEGE